MLMLIVSIMLPQWAWAAITTYDFASICKDGDKPVNVDKNNPVTIDGQTLYMPTADSYNLEGRFAFQQIYAGSCNYREWQIRKRSNGLFAQSPQNNNTHFAILNILKDDKITITSSSANYLFFTGNPILKDVKADDVVESGKEYTATANGSILINIRNAKKVNIVISKITIESNNEIVTPPTLSITKIDGINREITITSGSSSINNTTKTYYTTDNSNPTEKSTEYTRALTFSENTTLKAITISSSGIKSTISTNTIEAGTTVKLEAPVFTKTAWSDGKATFSFNNKSSVLLNPTVTIKCTSGNADNINNNTVTLLPGKYSFHAEAEGYENSDDVILNVIADRQMTLAETLDFTDKCNSYNAKVSLNSTSEYNDGKQNYYSFAYSASYDDANKEERLITYATLFARKNYGLQNQEGGGRFVALKDIKKGQLIKIYSGNTGGGSTVLEPTETDKAIVPNESTTSVSAIEAIQDGTIAFSIPKLCYISKIEIYNITEIKKTIPASGYSSYSASFATTVPEGVSVYKAKAESDKVVLSKIETSVIPANTGVILYSDIEGEKSFIATEDETSADWNNNDLIATSVTDNATVPATGNYYALFANKAAFGQLTNGITISGNKAYLKGVETTDNEAKTLNIVLSDETTGISNVDVSTTKSQPYYSLQGVKTSNPRKGLYIQNGKKIIIK